MRLESVRPSNVCGQALAHESSDAIRFLLSGLAKIVLQSFRVSKIGLQSLRVSKIVFQSLRVSKIGLQSLRV